MKMKIIKTLMLTSALALSGIVSAAPITVSWADDADTNGERALTGTGVNNAGNPLGNVFETTDGAANVDITVTAGGDNPYLDDSGSYGRAGLGVCGELDGVECLDAADDSLTNPEELMLSFSQEVVISQILFRNYWHGTSFSLSAIVEINIDGGGWKPYFIADFSDVLTGSTFEFRAGQSNSGFYIESITFDVPEPATLGLLGLALMGAGAARRRKVA